MNSIERKFRNLEASGGRGFIPFVTAGDPDLETSLAIVSKLADLGADVIELGVPFSDPMADGPTIQRSSERSLRNGTTLRNVLELASSFRAKCDVPLVLFSYFNPIHRFGLKTFAREASMAGIDGVLLTDVIEQEAAQISHILAENSIDLISLIAPTTSDDRLSEICSRARGFIYAVSRAGVTGVRESTGSAAKQLVDRAKRLTNLPIAVGFGISTREQIEEVWEYADAAVVGSAIVSVIENSEGNAVEAVENFVRGLVPEVSTPFQNKF